MSSRAVLLCLVVASASASSAAGQSTTQVCWRAASSCSACQPAEPAAPVHAVVEKRVFNKPPAASQATAEQRIAPQAKAPVRRAVPAVEPTVAAVIRRDDAGPTNRIALEREIKLAILDRTLDYRVETDGDGRMVVTATLPAVSDHADLVAYIRAMPELGRHVVIVRGIVK